MDKEKMIDDIVAMLDNEVASGNGHINVKMEESDKNFVNVKKEVIRGCAENSSNPTACSVPTMELPDDDEFER